MDRPIVMVAETIAEAGIEALEANWEGYEDIRQLMIQAPKYGNDDDYADEIAVQVHHRTADVMAEFTDRFGTPCRGDGSGVSATYGCALDTPATPDGRRAGEPFADATLSPSQGMDREGPTAVLKSAAKLSLLHEVPGLRFLFSFLEVRRPGAEVLHQLPTRSRSSPGWNQ